jgi:lipoteichoic acid synthase
MGVDKNPFKNYWVPLIIYSPLLKNPAEFKGLCSHIDILPSLLGLLQQNFGLNFPENKHWIGAGLDTSRTFNANRSIPLNLNAMDMPNFVVDRNVLYGNEIFRFDSTLNIYKEPDNVKSEIIRQKINNFCYLNSYVCLRNKIWN